MCSTSSARSLEGASRRLARRSMECFVRRETLRSGGAASPRRVRSIALLPLLVSSSIARRRVGDSKKMLHARRHPARQCEILLSAPSCLARQPPRREDAKVLVDRNMMPRAAGVDAKRPAARGGGHGGVCPSGAFKHPGDRLSPGFVSRSRPRRGRRIVLTRANPIPETQTQTQNPYGPSEPPSYAAVIGATRRRLAKSPSSVRFPVPARALTSSPRARLGAPRRTLRRPPRRQP